MSEPNYRKLDGPRLIVEVDHLRNRIGERFPGSGLHAVCAELLAIARTTERRARRISGPYVWLRALVAVALLAAAVAVAAVIYGMDRIELHAPGELFGLAQGLESIVNLVILAGAAAWFLLGLEERLRHRRVQTALHELRSIAHVIDMHQLTKDPTALAGPRTTSSPDRAMTPFEISRYLDYCAEMLALTAKLAALYAGGSGDPVVTAGVSDIETLTGSLSRSIWQKLVILSAEDGPNLRAGATKPPSPPA
ncbi:MAG: hypothetical protein ACXWVJ_01770 [Caulobacteraceae bacterium]